MESAQNYTPDEIYKVISEVVVDSDFRVAQNSFFEQNCKQFDDEDENKHIYKKIYDEYIKILDEVVEAQVMKKLPNVNIQVFFEDLQNNFKKYQEENSEVIEILFSFLDFEKFKKLMITQKKGVKDDVTYEEKLKILNSDEDFKYCLNLLNEPLENGWKKVIDNKKLEFVCYEKKYRNTGLYMMRTAGRLQGVRYTTVSEMAKDLDSLKNFAEKDSIKEIYPIEETPQGRYAPIMSDREYVLKQFTIHDEKNKEATIISQSVNHEKAPEKKGIIRAEMLKVSKVREDPNDPQSCILKEVMFNDLHGYIPKMLMNMMISKIAEQGIVKFREGSIKYQEQQAQKNKK